MEGVGRGRGYKERGGRLFILKFVWDLNVIFNCVFNVYLIKLFYYAWNCIDLMINWLFNID